MTIAIDISAGRSTKITERFHFKCFSKIASDHPGHHFIFLFDTHPDPELYLEPNCTPVIVSPAMKNSLLRHYWYNYKVPSMLAKYNADVFVTSGSTCSLRTDVPQCMIVESLSLSYKKTGPYWKKFMPAFLKAARSVCVTNPIITDELIKKFGAQPQKVSLIYPGADLDLPAPEDEKAKIKTWLTNGMDFFFYECNSAGLNNLIAFLKAFTIFKKWQQSDMQLVISLKVEPDAEITKQLSLYKYIGDVHLIRERASEVLPAAYAAIIFDDHLYPSSAINASRAGIPLILNESVFFRKYFDDAALYTGLSENDIASKMMLLYKNEHTRRLQIQKGLHMTKGHSWDHAASAVWKVLIESASK